MQPDMRLRAASVSKTFVAAAALQLVEAGRIALDQSIDKWFPELPNASTTTVRQLLNHSSGIADYAGSAEYSAAMERVPGTAWSHQRPTELALKLPRDFAPGERHVYSNSNYHLLGSIIEAETKRPLFDHMRGTLLRQADLPGVRLDDGSGPHPADARAYVRGDSGAQEDVTDTYHGPNSLWRSTGWADGAAIASASELARWGQALLGSDRILRPETLREMTRNALSTREGYGLGIFGDQPLTSDNHYTSLSHSGGDIGFGSLLARFPDLDASVAVMVNGTMSPEAEPLIQLARRAAEAVTGN